MIEPPAGYALIRTEALTDSTEGPDSTTRAIRRELGLDEDFTLGDTIIFRTIVKCPDGSSTYTSTMVDSLIDLCKKPFWEEFWKQVQCR